MPVFDGKAWFRSKIAPYLTKIKAEIPPELSNATVAAGTSNVYGVMTPAQLTTFTDNASSGASAVLTDTELIVSVGASATGADYQNIADAYDYFRQANISPTVQPVIEIRGAVAAADAIFPNYGVRDLIIRGSAPLDIGTGYSLTTSPLLVSYLTSRNVNSIDLHNDYAVRKVSSTLTFENLFLHAHYHTTYSFHRMHGSDITFRYCVLSNITFDHCTDTTISVFASVVFNSDLLKGNNMGTELRTYPIYGSGGIVGAFKVTVGTSPTPTPVLLPAFVNTRETGGGAGRITGQALYLYSNTIGDRFFDDKIVNVHIVNLYLGEIYLSYTSCMTWYRTQMHVHTLHLNMEGVSTSTMAGVACVGCNVSAYECDTLGNRSSTPSTMRFSSTVANLRIGYSTETFNVNTPHASDVRITSGSTNITYSQSRNVRNSSTKSIIIK